MRESFKKNYKTITNQDEFIDLSCLKVVKGHWMLARVQFMVNQQGQDFFGGYPCQVKHLTHLVSEQTNTINDGVRVLIEETRQWNHGRKNLLPQALQTKTTTKWNIRTGYKHIKPLQKPFPSYKIDGGLRFNLRHAINFLVALSTRN